MIAHKKTFNTGLALMVAFTVVLVAMFMPLFGGHNGLEYLDSLYNSISKGSANYIHKATTAAAKFNGRQIEVTLGLKSTEQADQVAKQLNAGGALINVSGQALKVSGDLGKLLANCLADAKLMYENNGDAIKSKYGVEARRVMYNWWHTCTLLEEALNKQEQFKEANAVHTALTKAVEPAYNYFGIQAQNIKDRLGVVVFSLLFYVIYTLWYGFGIMYLFEGWGLRLEH